MYLNRFHYMAISDERQRYMPTREDREPPRSEQLAYPEARLLTNPSNPSFKGEVCLLIYFSSILTFVNSTNCILIHVKTLYAGG